MLFTNFRSGCPLAKRTTETFFEWISIGGERKRVEFQREIVWLSNSESTLKFIHGGEILHEMSTFNDFYGYLSSSDPKDAVTLAAKFGISPTSSLELVMFTKNFLMPAVETDECKKNNLTKPPKYKSMWAYVPNSWHQERVESSGRMSLSLSGVDLDEQITWSSKKTDTENQQTRAIFLDKWTREATRDAVLDAVIVDAIA